MNTVQGQLQILQQMILVVETESRSGGSGMTPSYITGGHNEQENLRSINQSGDRYIHKMKVQISCQSSSKDTISEPHPGTLPTNEMDSNADTC